MIATSPLDRYLRVGDITDYTLTNVPTDCSYTYTFNCVSVRGENNQSWAQIWINWWNYLKNLLRRDSRRKEPRLPVSVTGVSVDPTDYG